MQIITAMENKADNEDQWATLRKQLDEDSNYPKVYFFKFIVPGDNRSIAQIEAVFGPEAQVDLRMSRNKKYASISAKEVMLSTDAIIERYEQAIQIKGCIAM